MTEPSGNPTPGLIAAASDGNEPAVTAANDSAAAGTEAGEKRRKGPLSYLSGALTSGMMAWICLIVSQRMVAYYVAHPPHYKEAIAQSIATGFKTLILGMGFLATFSFAFIGLGLFLVFLRCLIPAGARTPS
jgi:hypothetical protein